jgi:hypothetical protein
MLNGNGEHSDLQGLQKPRPNAMSNSFNPPIPRQSTPPLPAIQNQQNGQSNTTKPVMTSTDISSAGASTSDEIDLVLPTKVFKAKKTSVNDLSQAACSYLWFRRIKEIFLVMGKQNDAFTRFDMELARTDMIQTCEQYLESERPKGGGSDLVSIDELLEQQVCSFIVEQTRPSQSRSMEKQTIICRNIQNVLFPKGYRRR